MSTFLCAAALGVAVRENYYLTLDANVTSTTSSTTRPPPSTLLHNGLAWLHVPKASSSARTIFASVLDINPCCVDAAARAANLRPLPSCTVSRELLGCDNPHPEGATPPTYWTRPWSDHTAIDEEAYNEWRGRFVGIFRHPLARAVSSVAFFGVQPGMTVPESLQQFAGAQTHMLSGVCSGVAGTTTGSMGDNPPCPHETTQADREVAHTRLREGFAFVGLTDSYVLSVCLFHAMHGGPCTRNDFLNINPTDHPDTSGSGRRSFSSDQLYGYADHFHDDDDMAVFNIVHERFCTDLATYDVTHERCANEICPEAASELRAVAPESGRPGEVMSLCPGREQTVLLFQPNSTRGGRAAVMRG